MRSHAMEQDPEEKAKGPVGARSRPELHITFDSLSIFACLSLFTCLSLSLSFSCLSFFHLAFSSHVCVWCVWCVVSSLCVSSLSLFSLLLASVWRVQCYAVLFCCVLLYVVVLCVWLYESVCVGGGREDRVYVQNAFPCVHSKRFCVY